MSTANERQVGGVHYKTEYQHWDFVCDTGLSYLAGCATKYVSRWWQKNGMEDLEKAIHYIEKIKERSGDRPPRSMFEDPDDNTNTKRLRKFVTQLPPYEGAIIAAIFHGHYDIAIEAIRKLISTDQC